MSKSGNVIKCGKVFERELRKKHRITAITHWNHVMKRGASN